jgi:Asp/Glu/hydantoin racemase
LTASKLAFIHTSHVLIPLFAQLAKDNLPGVEVFHMSDESLIRNTMAAGSLTASTIRRVVGMIDLAHQGGGDVVMVTCSSIGAAIPIARRQFNFPIIRIDEAMAEMAVRAGKRIGVAATVRTTLEPTINLLAEKAIEAGRDIDIDRELCTGAFEALLAGDMARHDELVTAGISALRKRVDAVVLAQASMLRVASQMDLSGSPRVLSSPEVAVRSVARYFAATS